MSPDEAEQQAVHLLACSADMLPAPLPPISMFDLLEALQVREMFPMCLPHMDVIPGPAANWALSIWNNPDETEKIDFFEIIAFMYTNIFLKIVWLLIQIGIKELKRLV